MSAGGVRSRPERGRTCASMPTEPSVRIQVLAPRALRLAAIKPAASSGAGALLGAPQALVSDPLKFPERKTLNFFSILLVGGRKIALGAELGKARCPAF